MSVHRPLDPYRRRLLIGALAALGALAGCTREIRIPGPAPTTGHRPPPTPRELTPSDLVKTDIDSAVEVILQESLASARLLTEKLYPKLLGPGATAADRIEEDAYLLAGLTEYWRLREPRCGRRPRVRSQIRVAFPGARKRSGHRGARTRFPARIHRRPRVCVRGRPRKHDHAGVRQSHGVLRDRPARSSR